MKSKHTESPLTSGIGSGCKGPFDFKIELLLCWHSAHFRPVVAILYAHIALKCPRESWASLKDPCEGFHSEGWWVGPWYTTVHSRIEYQGYLHLQQRVFGRSCQSYIPTRHLIGKTHWQRWSAQHCRKQNSSATHSTIGSAMSKSSVISSPGSSGRWKRASATVLSSPWM